MTEDCPNLSVIVPARNEERQIADTVTVLRRALERTGCSSEVLVVDDASTDATAQRARAAGAEVNRRGFRGGPLAAWNAGLQLTTAPIVIFCDADVLPEEDAIVYLITPMADPRVGAVGARACALATGEGGRSRLVRASSRFSADLLHTLRLRLSDHDIVPMGRLMAVRRAALPVTLPEVWPCDRSVAHLVRRRGFAVVYEPRAHVWYLPPATWAGLRADYLRTRASRPPATMSFDHIGGMTIAAAAGSVARRHPARALAWTLAQIFLGATVRRNVPSRKGQGTLVWDSVHSQGRAARPASGTGVGPHSGSIQNLSCDVRGRPLVLVFSRFRPDRPGGVEAVAREQVVRLRAGGWDAQAGWAYDHRTLVARVPILGDLVAAQRFANIAGRSRPRVVLVNGAEYAWAFLGARARPGRRVVVVWHGVRSHQLRQYVRTGVLPALMVAPLGWANRALERRACSADQHVAVTLAVATDVTSTLHLASGRVEVIPNGASEAARQLQSTVPSPLTYRVVWVGAEGGWRPGQKKGLDLAIDACRRVRVNGLPISLTVVGLEAPPAWLSRGLAAEPWVRWLGEMSHVRVLQEIQGADALLAPSRAESMGLAMLDSIAVGRPVICHREVGGWLVGDAGILVESWSADAFASALAQLYAPGWDWSEFARVAHERAACFDWAVSGERYRRVVAALLGPIPDGPERRLDPEALDRPGCSDVP